jgi:hypothetical protein
MQYLHDDFIKDYREGDKESKRQEIKIAYTISLENLN